MNLSWAIQRQLQNIAAGKSADEKVALALRTADLIADEDAEHCRIIGQHGLALIRQIAETKRNKAVNVLTHCNAGGSHLLITAPRLRRSMLRTIAACHCMCG